MTLLRKIRVSRGLSQEQLAQRAGIDQRRVSTAERALDPSRISLGTAVAVSKALGITCEELLKAPDASTGS